MLKAEAHAVGGRPARAGQFAAQMRMLHRGETAMSLHPSRHAQCSGHLARSLEISGEISGENVGEISGELSGEIDAGENAGEISGHR